MIHSKASVHSYSVEVHVRSVFSGGLSAEDLRLRANTDSL